MNDTLSAYPILTIYLLYTCIYNPKLINCTTPDSTQPQLVLCVYWTTTTTKSTNQPINQINQQQQRIQYDSSVFRVQKLKPNLPKLILPSNMEIERELAPYGHRSPSLSPSPSPSPSPQPPIEYDVEVDPDNMVIRGGGDAFDPEIDPDNMVVPGSRAVTPNYDDEGVYQAHTWVRRHATIHHTQQTPQATHSTHLKHPEAESAHDTHSQQKMYRQLSLSLSSLISPRSLSLFLSHLSRSNVVVVALTPPIFVFCPRCVK